jgi:hypothetical protein
VPVRGPSGRRPRCGSEPRSRCWFEASSTRLAKIVGGLTAAFVGLYDVPLVALASSLRHREVPGALVGDLLDYMLGAVALSGLSILALFSATCWFALRQRVVRPRQAVADRQFPSSSAGSRWSWAGSPSRSAVGSCSASPER